MLKINNSLKIDIEKIIYLQNKYKNDLEIFESSIKLDNNYKYENNLKKIIEKETKKYENRLIDENKIKRKKVGFYLEELNKNIYNFLKQNIDDINIDYIIKSLNEIIFPKGIWGETMGPNGKSYYKKYESGKYRNNEEFISVGGTSYYFTSYKNIESSINNLDNFLNNKEVFSIIKIFIYIFYFLNIHPFNDGNGAIARFLFPILCLNNGLKIIDFDYSEIFIDKQTNLFYTKENIDFEKIFLNILNIKK